MGLFTSKCPSCDRAIGWFLKTPEDYVCACGKPVSTEEIEASWDKEYASTLAENTKIWIVKKRMSLSDTLQSIAAVNRFVEEAAVGKREWRSVSLFCNSIVHKVNYCNKTYFQAIQEYEDVGWALKRPS